MWLGTTTPTIVEIKIACPSGELVLASAPNKYIDEEVRDASG
jgi:hypothetical protein